VRVPSLLRKDDGGAAGSRRCSDCALPAARPCRKRLCLPSLARSLAASSAMRGCDASRCLRCQRASEAPSPLLTPVSVWMQTFLGHYRRDATKCDELCQELMALPDSTLEACLPQMW
jgi:hypothetical protein